MKIEKLKERYELACNDYAELFCKKQGLRFDGWVGGSVGEVAHCGDMFFNMFDIILDLNSNQKKGLIVEWHYSCLGDEQFINYRSYTKGLRRSKNK